MRAWLAELAAFPAAPAPWSLGRRVAFRFAFAYVLLTFFPAPLPPLPGVDVVLEAYGKAHHAFVVWVAAHVLHLASAVPDSAYGSGDDTGSWVWLLAALVLAAVAAGVWSLLARRRRDHARLQAILFVYARYVLAFAMIAYGLFKVLKSQFPTPGPDELLETYGESSPMHLLWTFMGASTVYTFFGGASEVLGGVLLLWRRTVTLGALVCMGVLANVVMLNLSYDVPVKIYSSHLFLLAALLAAPDAGRLARFFLGRAVEASPTRARYATKGLERARIAAKVLFVGASLFCLGRMAYVSWTQWGDGAKTPALYGTFEVESFEKDGAPVPPLATDATRWKRIAFLKRPYVSIYGMDDARKRWSLEHDEAKHELVLTRKEEGGAVTKRVFAYTRADDDHLVLEEKGDGASTVVHLARRDPKKDLLVTRGFHWVNEYPMNR